jgi:hypothetical protein
VVVAIIGILASLLLPALSAVRGKAKEISCLNNTKQQLLGILMYLDDNKNMVTPKTSMPAGYTSSGHNIFWGQYANPIGLGVLVKDKYLDPSILFCPGRSSEIGTATSDYHKMRNPSNALNVFMSGGISCDTSLIALWVAEFTRDGYADGSMVGGKIHNFNKEKPSMPIVGDAWGGSNYTGNSVSYGKLYTPHGFKGTNIGFLEGSARWISIKEYAGQYFNDFLLDGNTLTNGGNTRMKNYVYLLRNAK